MRGSLSEVSTRIDLPSVHVPTALSRERKAICNSRMSLLATRTKLTNYVRGRLRAAAVVLRRRSPETFPKLARAALLAQADGIGTHLERVLLTVEMLNEQIKEADREPRAKPKEWCKTSWISAAASLWKAAGAAVAVARAGRIATDLVYDVPGARRVHEVQAVPANAWEPIEPDIPADIGPGVE